MERGGLSWVEIAVLLALSRDRSKVPGASVQRDWKNEGSYVAKDVAEYLTVTPCEAYRT
jgi:hypothetical protein